ncbi:hypothetical protein RF11_10913 [Thelohanellus kitauei]|uniref:Uncharacterized protein n=1 Tax=Thelohanellus kitauei TaxID=669202 RepID=A0A0C2NCX8_THEKT|nr:hypothetical protein RF11_10913 [Thelohanellus kitauei]
MVVSRSRIVCDFIAILLLCPFANPTPDISAPVRDSGSTEDPEDKLAPIYLRLDPGWVVIFFPPLPTIVFENEDNSELETDEDDSVALEVVSNSNSQQLVAIQQKLTCVLRVDKTNAGTQARTKNQGECVMMSVVQTSSREEQIFTLAALDAALPKSLL